MTPNICHKHPVELNLAYYCRAATDTLTALSHCAIDAATALLQIEEILCLMPSEQKHETEIDGVDRVIISLMHQRILHAYKTARALELIKKD